MDDSAPSTKKMWRSLQCAPRSLVRLPFVRPTPSIVASQNAHIRKTGILSCLEMLSNWNFHEDWSVISRRSRQTHESRSAIHCGPATCMAAPRVLSSEQFFSPMRSFMTSIPGVLNSMRSGQCELILRPNTFRILQAEASA